MDSKRIDEIIKIKWALRAGIKPLKKKDDATEWTIVGFDTEYNVERSLLVSYQLYVDEESNILLPGPQRLSLRSIADEAYRLSGGSHNLLLVSYYNTAELGWTSEPFWEDKDVTNFYMVHPSGLYHVEGQTDNEEGQCFSWYFFDLWHFFASYKNSSLYKVAEDFGLSKLDYDVRDLSLESLNDPKLIEYAIHDAKLCVEIFNALDSTYRDFSGVSIITRPTPANAASAAFRLNYLKQEVKAPPKYVRRLALAANWAGRVECGYVGIIDGIHEFDADSLYPRSVLLLPNLPSAKQWKVGIPENFDEVEGFITVDFQFPAYEEWPCLPVFGEGRLYFPLSGTSSCTIGELRAALSRGLQISKVWACAYYQDGIHDEYHTFISDRIHVKEDSDNNQARRAVAKLDMNSSIGKLIQNKGGMDYEAARKWIADNEELVPDWAIPYVYANDYRFTHTSFSNSVRLGSSFYPEWHTLILGKAREIMAYAIYNAASYPNILMISTDSLHVQSEKLGDTMVRFKHELGPVTFQAIRGRLHLSTDDDGNVLKIAHHGMPTTGAKAAEIILTATHKDHVVLVRKGKTTLRESVLRGVAFGSEKVDPDYKVSLRPDGKRRIDDIGWTHPLKVIA